MGSTTPPSEEKMVATGGDQVHQMQQVEIVSRPFFLICGSEIMQ